MPDMASGNSIIPAAKNAELKFLVREKDFVFAGQRDVKGSRPVYPIFVRQMGEIHVVFQPFAPI